MSRLKRLVASLAFSVSVLSGVPASAAIHNLSISGTDVIFLAGRTDIVIPPPSDPWSVIIRHPGPTPEESQETLPQFIPVAGGDIIRVADPAVGGINFFNGSGPPIYGPNGNGLDGSNLSGIDGISGYRGPQGPLAGVFLDDNIPSSGPAPITLDFGPGGLGTEFPSLSPELGQVFYIGDGVTMTGIFQEFIAPTGATRLFLGIPDGFGFVGAPGAYDDNDGAYRVRIGVNEVPVDVPEPAAIGLLGIGLIALASLRRRRG